MVGHAHASAGAAPCLATSRTADLAIRGTLHSVDQYLNIKLLNVSVDDVEGYPHMVRCRTLRFRSRLRLTRARAAAAIREELLHPWLGHQVRTTPCV